MKRVLSLIAVVLLLPVLAACASKPAPTTPAATGAPAPAPVKAIELVLTSGYSETHPRGQMAAWGADQIEKYTEGRYKVKTYLGASLIPQTGELEAVNKGTSDIATITSSIFEEKMPALQAVTIPASFDLIESALVFEEMRPLLDTEFAKNNAKFLWGVNAGDMIIETVKPLKTLDQLKGLKIRAGGGTHAEWLKMLGATPTTLASTETYMALKTGVVDGALSVFDTGLDMKWYETAPYFTIVGGSVASILTVMNLQRFNSMSKADQDAVMALSVRMNDYNLGKQTSGNASSQLKLIKLGAVMIYVSPEDQAKAANLTKPLWDNFVAKTGESGKKFLAVIDKYR